MTSSSPQSTMHRLRRGVLVLLLCLLLLEIGVRLPPVHAALSTALDPYESLLWYIMNMPAYLKQLQNGPHYDLWMLGSSYMMTGLDPRIVQAQLAVTGNPTTVQNYGYTGMTNLSEMALVVERWMLQYDKPRYAIIGIQMSNLFDGKLPARARSSPMERMIIFNDSPENQMVQFVFQNSDLFRFATLARNALTVPAEKTVVPEFPVGGYVERNKTMTCDPAVWASTYNPPAEAFEGHVARLDALINAFRQNGVEVAVVNIPSSYCGLRGGYSSTENYEQMYLDPLAAHLQAINVPYAELDRRFYAAYPDVDEQVTFYSNASHPNAEGAKLFSAWTGEFAAAWLNRQGQ